MLISDVSLFLIIINSILGGGLFVNIGTLNASVGSYGFLFYFGAYAFMLPIIYSIAKIAESSDKNGGIFELVQKNTNSYIAILGSWSYFCGRTFSVAALSLFLAKNLKNAYPGLLERFTELESVILIAGAIVFLNLCKLQGTGLIQKIFVILKLLPIFIITIVSLRFFSSSSFNFAQDITLVKSNFLPTFTSALYALQGFTIAIHISHMIKNKNSLRPVLFLASGTTAAICALVQFAHFSSGGAILFKNSFLVTNLMCLATFSSLYMLLTGNPWNLNFLLEKTNSWGRSFLTYKVHNFPIICLVINLCFSILALVILKNIQLIQAASISALFFSYATICISARRIPGQTTFSATASKLGQIFALLVCALASSTIPGLSGKMLIVFIILLGFTVFSASLNLNKQTAEA